LQNGQNLVSTKSTESPKKFDFAPHHTKLCTGMLSAGATKKGRADGGPACVVIVYAALRLEISLLLAGTVYRVEVKPVSGQNNL
jgi:hypothetical protein